MANMRQTPETFSPKHFKKVEADNVNQPAHYKTHSPGLESINIIYAILGAEGFEAYCRGSVLKYLARADRKGSTIEDLEKAAKYLSWEIKIRKEEA